MGSKNKLHIMCTGNGCDTVHGIHVSKKKKDTVKWYAPDTSQATIQFTVDPPLVDRRGNPFQSPLTIPAGDKSKTYHVSDGASGSDFHDYKYSLACSACPSLVKPKGAQPKSHIRISSPDIIIDG